MDVSRLLAHTQLDAPFVVLIDYDAFNNLDSEQQQLLLQQVASLRQQGYRVTMPLTAEDMPVGMTHRLSLADNQWRLNAV